MDTTAAVKQFSSGDIVAITGIYQNLLDRWVTAGLITPASGGRYSGDHRGYTLMHVLAVAAGMRWRAAGAGPDRVAGIVRFVSHLRREALEADLKAGRTFPVPAATLGANWLPGMMVEPPVVEDQRIALNIYHLDLARIYEDVKAKVAKLQDVKAKRQ